MRNIILVIPKLEEYSYEEKLEKDPNTMSYNAGYDVTYSGYHYDTGCINFNKEKWKDVYNKRIKENRYFAYIKDLDINEYVGYVNYQYNKLDNIYDCGILIEYKYRGKGYAKDALRLLIKEANNSGIEYLYDSFEKDRKNTLKTFLDVGFEVYRKTTWKKFNKDVDGVIVRINTNTILPNISKIKNIDDVLLFMKNNIRYGWLDTNGEVHIGNMKNFRKLYKTMTINEILKYGIGTCIDQVNLMNYILNNIGIKNKMFATRIYEPNTFDNLDAKEHMHCFVLCYADNKVYHIEHPNWNKIGIYEYKSEDEALKTINKYYVNLSNGILRPITEFYEVKPNISFKEFNSYINNLNITFRKLKNNKSDYELLYNWCNNRHVYEYFEQRKLNYNEIVDKYKTKLKEGKQELFIIKSDNKDIGLVQIYKYESDLKIEKLNKYRNVYEYDLFIGDDNYLNMGLGKKIVMCINDIIYKKYNADGILLRQFKRNSRAIKCYLKCDFKEIYSYTDSDTIGSKEEIAILLNEPDRWKFGMKPNVLAKLVLDGKKTATTSLYRYENLSKSGDFSVIVDSNCNSVCAIKTKRVVIKKFKDISWDLAKLEGENDSLDDWRKVHINFFSKIDNNFNSNTKVIFEIFEVLKKWK